MIPRFIEVGNLEQMAADQTPSLEGAWWIMLQTAVSIYNYAVVRDPVNNEVLDEFWHDVSADVSQLLSKNNIRPLPFDDMMQLIEYCGEQLHAIVKNPRHSIVKVDKMVMPYRVGNTGSKTMNWLGKQPGKTIKEKLSGKNKMLTQANEYTYDVKENQVAIALYKQIMKRVAERINYGIKNNAYDEDSHCDFISKMARIKKELRNTELAEVKPVNHTQANNVLLADKNYSVVWKAYLDMCKYNKKVEKNWNKAIELFTQAIYIGINAILTTFDEVQVIENRINFSKSLEETASYVVGYESENPIAVEVKFHQENIYISLFQPSINNASKTKAKTYEIKIINKIAEENLQAKRGCPLIISINASGKTETINIFADISGIDSVVNYCTSLISEYAGTDLTLNEEKDNFIEGTCTFDIASNGHYFAVDNEKMASFYCKKAVTYINQHEVEENFVADSKSVYKNSYHKIYLKDAIKKELQTEALKNALEEISDNVVLKTDDYFIYTIPDALEEFSQKKLKQCVNAWFPRRFPVWRSVAALTEIISDEENKIQPEDSFLCIDLIGETATAGLLTVKYEPSIDNYICNHYPPFPQSDAGDEITEEAFFRNYMVHYFELNQMKESDEIIEDIVDSGILYKLLDNCNYVNYTTVVDEHIKIIRIDFDDNILRTCVKDWLENLKDFWLDIKGRLPKGVHYANILSDCIMRHVDHHDVADILAKEDYYKGLFISTSQKISEGAFIYRDRLREHLPTWTEYLPKLSLEVIKDGRYEELQLIGDDVSFDVMGESNEHPVPEKLMLRAGEKEFRFPLKKEDISRNAAMIEAYVTDKSFPLPENITAELLVRYKYGFDNSYELILKPYDIKNPPFDEIIVEWQTERRAPKVAKYPIYPGLTNYDKVLSDINEVNFRLNVTESNIKRFIVNYDNYNCSKLDFTRLTGDMTRQIFRIRNIIAHDDISEVKEFIESFYAKDLVKYLGEIAGLFKRTYICDQFFNDFGINSDGSQNDGFENLKCSAMQLIYAFGAKTPIEFQNFLIENYHDLNVRHKDNILLNMYYLNSGNSRITELILEESRNYKRMDSCIRELSSLCWFDPQMIFDLYNYPAFLQQIVNYISNELKTKSKKTVITTRDIARNQKKRYLRYVEMILAILRLREIEGFNLLMVDSKEARELARSIRVVDEIMEHPFSKIRFKVEKPEALRNMSDVAYAVDMYLTGNEGVDSIEVVSVESD